MGLLFLPGIRYPRSEKQNSFRVIPQVAANTSYETTTQSALIHTYSQEKSDASMKRSKKPLVRSGLELPHLEYRRSTFSSYDY